jgi:hypothetical protein
MQWAKSRQSSSNPSEKPKRQKINIDFHVEPDPEAARAQTSTSAVLSPGSSNLSDDPGASDPMRRDGVEHSDSDNRRNEHGPWESNNINRDHVSAWDYYGGSRQGNKGTWLSRDEDSSKYFGASDAERATENPVELNQHQPPQHNRASWEDDPSLGEAADKTRWSQLALPFLVVLAILGIAFATLIS